jgi:predicted transposase YbfD/YdcC
MERFRACFEDLVDPRTGNAQRHDLLEVLSIARAAPRSGAGTCVDMALVGQAKEASLRRFLRPEGGIPRHDTFSRLVRLLDPDACEAGFGRVVAAFGGRIAGTQGGGAELVARDGETARRSLDRQAERRPLPMVNAGAVEPRLVLGQRNVGDGNEIGALGELVARLDRAGRIVTADAMHGQKATARAILDRGGDYCLALKRNQPAPFDDLRLGPDDPATTVGIRHQTTDGDHGRLETRRARIVHDVARLAERHAFPGLAAVAAVTATRAVDGKSTTATRTYLRSTAIDAARLAHVVRSHWPVEHRRHGLLDLVMAEDQSRARQDHGPDNLARLRRFALDLPRASPDTGSTRGKIKRAAWDDTFLSMVLSA